MTDTEQRAQVHLRVIETLLDAAARKQNDAAVQEYVWSMAQALDAALVHILITQPQYELLRPLTQKLFTMSIPPSDEVRQRALALHRAESNAAYRRAKHGGH